MTTFDKDALLRISKLSGFDMGAADIDLFMVQIQKVLNFIGELQDVQITQTAKSVSNVNIFRDDISHVSDGAPLLEQAVQKHDRYFIVPKILNEK